MHAMSNIAIQYGTNQFPGGGGERPAGGPAGPINTREQHE